MPLIRDTIDPTREREVSDEEALDLERMGLLLTGTRAKTPDGLRAAAVRQVTEQLQGTAAAPEPRAAIGIGSPVNDDDPDDDDPDDDDPDDDEPQDPGGDPVSTTDDTPTSNQES